MDLDAFFCSVEEVLRPELRDRAFVVGGSPEGRGVVASASYAAREYGIRSAMPTAQAIRRCPQLIVLPGRHGEYSKRSQGVMALLRDSAPLVEQLSIDEAFLDISDDPTPGEVVAAALQTEIQSRFNLPTSWGVATNKLVAKIATEVGKPQGLVVVPPGGEREFLTPLPVQMLWGVGPKTHARLGEVNIHQIGQLAALSDDEARALFGEHGIDLATRARGVDSRPVVEGHEPKSLSAERTFSEDLVDGDELRHAMLGLCERVGYRIRRAGLAGGTVRIKVRWSDFTTLTRQVQLTHPTDQDEEIFRAAWKLFLAAWQAGRPVRLLGVGLAGLSPPIRQLNLFEHAWERDERLLHAIDKIRSRFGRDAVRRATSLRRHDPRDGIDREDDTED
jgi:DNA polymerase-4